MTHPTIRRAANVVAATFLLVVFGLLGAAYARSERALDEAARMRNALEEVGTHRASHVVTPPAESFATLAAPALLQLARLQVGRSWCGDPRSAKLECVEFLRRIRPLCLSIFEASRAEIAALPSSMIDRDHQMRSVMYSVVEECPKAVLDPSIGELDSTQRALGSCLDILALARDLAAQREGDGQDATALVQNVFPGCARSLVASTVEGRAQFAERTAMIVEQYPQPADLVRRAAWSFPGGVFSSLIMKRRGPGLSARVKERLSVRSGQQFDWSDEGGLRLALPTYVSWLKNWVAVAESDKENRRSARRRARAGTALPIWVRTSSYDGLDDKRLDSLAMNEIDARRLTHLLALAARCGSTLEDELNNSGIIVTSTGTACRVSPEDPALSSFVIDLPSAELE